MSITVICDRCRATGLSGTGDFTHLGDLLEFDPVPVQPRVNGWDPEAQRAFIALLATTGSKRRAALAIGRNAHGITQLLKRPGADSFRLAYDRALAIAKQHGAMKLAQGMADAAARNAQMRPRSLSGEQASSLIPLSRLRGLPAPAEDEDDGKDDEFKLALLNNIFRKYIGKVEAERTARLAGRIVEADFNLRQVTGVEIALDLVAHGFGMSTWDVILDCRRGGCNLLNIAETPISHALDDARRKVWTAAGDPPRPEHPPRRYLDECDGYSLEPTEFLWGGSDAEREEQIAKQERQHAEDAAAQIAFEAEARAHWAACQQDE